MIMKWTWQKYKVLDVQDDVYTIVDESNNESKVRIHFYDLNVTVGDYLTISSFSFHELTAYGLSKYYYGPLGTKYSKKLDKDHEYEKLTIEHNGENVVYQRYYG